MLPPAIGQKLRESVEQHKELEQQLSAPELAGNPGKFKVVARECGALAKLVERYKSYELMRQSLEENEAIAADSGEDEEVREMGREEIDRPKPLVEAAEQEPVDRVPIEDKHASGHVHMELTAGTGRDGAAGLQGQRTIMGVEGRRTIQVTLKGSKQNSADVGIVQKIKE